MNTTHYDHLLTWRSDGAEGFRLELYDTCQTAWGKSRLAYQFFHGEEQIFEGDDFGASPLHSIDGPETVKGLLTFLSLKPGDTDEEYFDSYTPRQLEWCQAHGETLSLYADDDEAA